MGSLDSDSTRMGTHSCMWACTHTNTNCKKENPQDVLKFAPTCLERWGWFSILQCHDTGLIWKLNVWCWEWINCSLLPNHSANSLWSGKSKMPADSARCPLLLWPCRTHTDSVFHCPGWCCLLSLMPEEKNQATALCLLPFLVSYMWHYTKRCMSAAGITEVALSRMAVVLLWAVLEHQMGSPFRKFLYWSPLGNYEIIVFYSDPKSFVPEATILLPSSCRHGRWTSLRCLWFRLHAAHSTNRYHRAYACL